MYIDTYTKVHSTILRAAVVATVYTYIMEPRLRSAHTVYVQYHIFMA